MKQISPKILLFLIAFINMVGVGIILPLLPYYVKIIEQSGNPLLADNRAFVVGALTASYALMQFLFVPVLGALSDRVGRRPVLLVSLLGTAFSYILLAMADSFLFLGIEVVLIVLFTARILDGITGGTISTIQAYIADTTTPEERSKGMGLIGAAFGLGFMLGPAIGGLFSTISLQAPALVAAGVSFAGVIAGYFLLPESLAPAQRTQIPVAKMNPLNQFRGLIANRSLNVFIGGMFLFYLAFSGMQSNFAVFTDVQFGFTPLDNALVFALVGLVTVIVQGVLIGKLIPRFGEARLAVTGLALTSLWFALIPMVTSGWMLYPLLMLLALSSGIATPSITGLISQRAPADQQGRVLGSTNALVSLTMVLGPLYAGFIFDVLGASATLYQRVPCSWGCGGADGRNAVAADGWRSAQYTKAVGYTDEPRPSGPTIVALFCPSPPPFFHLPAL
ncbi:MAG: TCR/Tet family MFS transporter [Chloroflexaceae bacterium]|nr:TCR/Tet family MFS transporter [Chloroflexaceae bacterium]